MNFYLHNNMFHSFLNVSISKIRAVNLNFGINLFVNNIKSFYFCMQILSYEPSKNVFEKDV